MGLFLSSFVILLLVAISDILARLVPHISSTYINILIGVLAACVPVLNHAILGFENDVFMTLIIAPLLFFEGQRTALQIVGRRVRSIFGSAIVLAIISAVVATIVIRPMLGGPFALALIVVAISTPTDATALGSVSQGHKLQHSVEKALTLEALFNDATGLVLLQAALIWYQTGHLNLLQNSGRLLLSAGGGVLIGAVIALVMMLGRQFLLRSAANVISSQTLFYLLTPFIVYLVAEHLGVSGIIATVTAGLINNSEAIRSRFSSPRQMHLGLQLVNFADDVLNSFVFVVLGINLGRIVLTRHASMVNNLSWLVIGLSVYLILLVCRFVYAKLLVADRTWLSSVLFAFGGVHGTVTLAMTFSILGQGLASTTFNLILLAEATVILLSMVVPTLLFHLILPRDWDEAQRPQMIKTLRYRAVHAGIKAVKQLSLSKEVKQIVIFDLKDQMGLTTLRWFWREWRGVSGQSAVLTSLQSVEQRRALMQAFKVERDYLYEQAATHQVPSTYVYDVYAEVLLAETIVLDPQNQVI